jgi:hypothetical protein
MPRMDSVGGDASDLTGPTWQISVFYSYADEDERACEQLETFVVTLRREGRIKGCHDHQITAGAVWRGVISAHLERADLVLRLVCAEILNARYCYEVEMTTALARQADGLCRVFPIIVDFR